MSGNPPPGIRYQTATSRFDLTRPCVAGISRVEHDPPAVQIHIASGPCQPRFKRYFRRNAGRAVTASFQGQRLSGPARIVGPMRATFVQPLRSNAQAEAIRDYYGAS